MTQAHPAKVANLLEKGTLELKGQFLLGSNYTFLVNVQHDGQELPAVYKPQRGEQPLWDFPEASLAGREVAAYLVSQALGWSLVPVTVLRDGPLGPGSLQEFINYNPNYHYFTFTETDRQRLRPVVLFDLLINNADRKGSHLLIQKRTRRLYSIDHGLCFHTEDKLRSVLWDFCGEPFPAELVQALQDLRARFEAQVAPGLGTYLEAVEIAALSARLERLVAEPVFPPPPAERRAYPYPPL
jgi:uncharacterized repeat protein (TIGR03843 family)